MATIGDIASTVARMQNLGREVLIVWKSICSFLQNCVNVQMLSLSESESYGCLFVLLLLLLLLELFASFKYWFCCCVACSGSS